MSEVECHLIQQDEFLALSYIYLDEMKTSKETAPHKFSILCKPYSRDQLEYQLNILFEYTKTYPNTPIKYEFDPIVGITRDNVVQMAKVIEKVIDENFAKPMVYDIVEEIRNWIEQFLVQGRAYRFVIAQEVKKQQHFQKVKFETFTPVTIQNFLAWKKEFDAKHKKVQKQDGGEQKATGKEWFLGKKEDEIQDSEDEDEDDNEQQDQQKIQQLPEEQNNDLFDPNP